MSSVRGEAAAHVERAGDGVRTRYTCVCAYTFIHSHIHCAPRPDTTTTTTTTTSRMTDGLTCVITVFVSPIIGQSPMAISCTYVRTYACTYGTRERVSSPTQLGRVTAQHNTNLRSWLDDGVQMPLKRPEVRKGALRIKACPDVVVLVAITTDRLRAFTTAATAPCFSTTHHCSNSVQPNKISASQGTTEMNASQFDDAPSLDNNAMLHHVACVRAVHCGRQHVPIAAK